MEVLIRARIGIEAGVWSVEDAERLRASGLGGRLTRILVEPVEASAEDAVGLVEDIHRALDKLGLAAPRLQHGDGEATWVLLADAIRRGIDTRVGLEDTLYGPDGKRTAGNEALVHVARGLGAAPTRRKNPPAEVPTAFELDRLVAEQVREAVAEGAFPLVLSGNCNTAVGTIAGLDAADLGVVWFDAHADFNTPETTTTGFTDGMGLAVAVGHCWKETARGVPGFTPVFERDVVLAGVRAMEPAEEERLAASDVSVVGADRIGLEGPGALEEALDRLEDRIGKVYVHLDLDVLDPEK